jgi:hypothetical protein
MKILDFSWSRYFMIFPYDFHWGPVPTSPDLWGHGPTKRPSHLRLGLRLGTGSEARNSVRSAYGVPGYAKLSPCLWEVWSRTLGYFGSSLRHHKDPTPTTRSLQTRCLPMTDLAYPLTCSLSLHRASVVLSFQNKIHPKTLKPNPKTLNPET